MPQTTEELEAHLKDEVGFLRDACAAFDGGKMSYSKQIAVTLRKLLHDTSASHSLLAQMGLKAKWTWMDTADEIDPLNLMPTYGLVTMTVAWNGEGADSVTTYAPLLDAYPRAVIYRESAFSRIPIERMRGISVSFTRWWTRPVMKDLAGNAFSRSDLVLKVANQDGGAHVGPTISGSYVVLSREGSLAIPVQEPDGSMTLSTVSPVPASLRQIGFEVFRTIRHFRPDLAV